jgi:hypothetical protein
MIDQTPNTNCAARELLETWRAVANAKLTEFRRQCWRLSMLVRRGTVDRQAAVDRLWEIAIAHALVRALGEDRIQAILDESFADADFPANGFGGRMSALSEPNGDELEAVCLRVQAFKPNIAPAWSADDADLLISAWGKCREQR